MKWKKFARGFHNKFQEAPNNLRICVMSQVVYFFVSFLSWSQQFLNSIITFFDLHLAATIPKISKLIRPCNTVMLSQQLKTSVHEDPLSPRTPDNSSGSE